MPDLTFLSRLTSGCSTAQKPVSGTASHRKACTIHLPMHMMYADHLRHVLAPWLEQGHVPRAEGAFDACVQGCKGIAHGDQGICSTRTAYYRGSCCTLAALILRKQSRQVVDIACCHALQPVMPEWRPIAGDILQAVVIITSWVG